jgi:CRISPR-associated protein Cmr6
MAHEVVTTHHLDYYGSEGRTPATDLDSPIPNAQVAVHGTFLFVIEGPQGWMHLAEEMLSATLTNAGLGAKRRAGYGYFVASDGEKSGPSTRCQWVDDTISALMQKNRSKEDEALRGKGLAELWQAIDDPERKQQAWEDIRSRWQAQGWWDEPPGGAARKAKAIYDGGGS